MSDKKTRKYLEKASLYFFLATYYQYLNPEKHIYYYRKHYHYMKKLVGSYEGDDHDYDDYDSYSGYDGYMRSEKKHKGTTKGIAKVRVFHASPDAPAVDVYANGQKIVQNLSYKQLSPYLQVPSGQYTIEVYPAGKTNTPVLRETVNVMPDKTYTVAAVGKLNNLQLLPIVDQPGVPEGKTKVRFAHLSPDAPAVDIAVKGGNVLFSNVSFKEVTNYLTLAPTTVDLEVRKAGTNEVVLLLLNVKLEPNKVYTIAAVGLAQGTPALEAVILPG